MIEWLQIRNFQGHDYLELELDPFITTVVGPTDTGKSALWRALRWVCLNRPNGDAFIKEGTNQTTVIVRCDGREISRCKGDKKNEYYLDKERYVSFGQDVPTDISQLLRLQDVNFQSQHDAPFWLGLSPGEASRELNAVVDLELSDRLLAHLNSQCREAKTTIVIREADLLTARQQRDSLLWTEEASVLLQQVEGKWDQLAKIRANLNAIALFRTQWDSLTLKRQRANKAKIRASLLKRQADRIITVKKSITELTLLIRTLKRKEVRMTREHITKILRCYEHYEQLTLSADRLHTLLTSYDKAREDLCAAQQTLGVLRRRLAKVKICPTCQQPLV